MTYSKCCSSEQHFFTYGFLPLHMVLQKRQVVMEELQVSIGDWIMGFHSLVWGLPMIAVLFIIGIYLTLRSKFLQVRKFGYAMRHILGHLGKKSGQEGEMTSFQAVCTALASTIGTGNIAGVAGAIAIGGPGAIFWMWVSALFGMGTKFFEIVLAVRFREKNANGDWVGGPMYYIKNGLGPNWYWLAKLFCVCGILAVLGSGCITQVNTMANVICQTMEQYHLKVAQGTKLILGAVLALLTGWVLLGGIQSLGALLEKMVPLMAGAYLILGVGIIVVNFQALPGALSSIFTGAFTPQAVTGGVVVSLWKTLRCGVARGTFSNEAGQGTSPIAHASANAKDPVEQGLYGIFEVFVDTFLICTLSALIILCSGVTISYGRDAGAELATKGFYQVYGNWSGILMAGILSCFAYSTVLGWGFYGVRCWEFLFGSKLTKPFLLVYASTAMVGATMELGLVWKLGETLNGLMSVPNLIAVVMLSRVVLQSIKNYRVFSVDKRREVAKRRKVVYDGSNF